MFLVVLDADFRQIGEVDAFSSLQWFRRYYSPSEALLWCDLQYLDLMRQGNYLYKKGGAELALIESITADKSELRVSGRLCEGLLARRVVNPAVTAADENAESLARRIVDANCVSAQGRETSRLSLGLTSGLADVISTETGNDNVLNALYKILKPLECGLRVRYDYEADWLFFEVYRGLDRRDEQTDNNQAVFSDNFENVLKSVYERDAGAFFNFAFCEGANGLRVEVDQTNGGERREIYVKDERFTNADNLRQKGVEELKKYQLADSLSGTVDGLKNLIYREDFDLGDLVTFRDASLGLSTAARITEIIEIYEGNGLELKVSFGEESKEISEILRG